MSHKILAIVGPLLISIGLAGLLRTVVVGQQAALLIYGLLAAAGGLLTLRSIQRQQR